MQKVVILLGLGLAALAGCNDSANGVVGVSEAQAKGFGGSKTIRLFGDTFFTPPFSQQDPTGTLNTMQSGKGKGFGNSTFTAQSEVMLGGDPAGCPLFGDAELNIPATVTTALVLTYPDGSLLTLEGEAEACTNEAASRFEVLFLEEDSTVTLGTGPRFEGASGSWSGSFTAEVSQLRGEVELSLSFN